MIAGMHLDAAKSSLSKRLLFSLETSLSATFLKIGPNSVDISEA